MRFPVLRALHCASFVSIIVVGCGPPPEPETPPPALAVDEDEQHDVDNGVDDDGDGRIDETGPATEAEALLPAQNVPVGDAGAGATPEKIITVASWNLRQFTSDKSTSPPAPIPGATNMLDAVFRVLNNAGVDIAALQEAYHYTGDPLATVPAGWAAISGAEIFGPTREHCTIVYQPADLTCTPVADLDRWRSGGRGINWVSCTALADKAPVHPFFFGCAHFAYSSPELGVNIEGLFDQLAQNGAGPQLGGTNRDNFILGLDANSNGTFGRRSRLWKTRQRDLADNGGPTVALEPYSATGPQFTKYRRLGLGFSVSTRDPILDELVWHVINGKPLTYRAGSKRIVPLNQMFATPPGFSFAACNDLSDHFPVASDFNVS